MVLVTTTTWISGDSSGNLVTPGTITLTATSGLTGEAIPGLIGGEPSSDANSRSLIIGHSNTGVGNSVQNVGVGWGNLQVALITGDFNTGIWLYNAGS